MYFLFLFLLLRLLVVGFRSCKIIDTNIVNSITYEIYKYHINQASIKSEDPVMIGIHVGIACICF